MGRTYRNGKKSFLVLHKMGRKSTPPTFVFPASTKAILIKIDRKQLKRWES